MSAMFALLAVFSLGCADAPLDEMEGLDSATDALGWAEVDDKATAGTQWYSTCGDPVCSGWSPKGIRRCRVAQEGDLCTRPGVRCDPIDGCNSLLVCSARDPKAGGCPISLAEHKTDIAYIDPAAARELHDELMRYRLATWRYLDSDNGAGEKLGFIIDDVGQSPSVTASGERVDLYGYTSMTVAALQEQSRQIEVLRAELAAVKGELEAVKTAR